MKFLNYMIDDSNSWINSALEYQSTKYPESKDILLAIKENLICQYQNYDRIIYDYKTEPKNHNFVGEKEKKYLLFYYTQPSSYLKEQFQKRRNNDLTECPYCGNPVQPNTLDHFIPKKSFPHYAIYQNNLVPQCRKCASIKGEKYFGNDACMYVHPFYNHSLSKIKFLVTFDFNPKINNLENFKVGLKLKEKSLNEIEKRRVLLHLKKIKVKERLIRYCLQEFSILRSRSKKYNFELDKYIYSRISIPEIIGDNWETAFYESLSKSNEAKSYLNSLINKTTSTLPEEDEFLDL